MHICDRATTALRGCGRCRKVSEGMPWCCRTGLNCRPLPYQGSALPLSYGSKGTRGIGLMAATKRGRFLPQGPRLRKRGSPGFRGKTSARPAGMAGKTSESGRNRPRGRQLLHFAAREGRNHRDHGPTPHPGRRRPGRPNLPSASPFPLGFRVCDINCAHGMR